PTTTLLWLWCGLLMCLLRLSVEATAALLGWLVEHEILADVLHTDFIDGPLLAFRGFIRTGFNLAIHEHRITLLQTFGDVLGQGELALVPCGATAELRFLVLPFVGLLVELACVHSHGEIGDRRTGWRETHLRIGRESATDSQVSFISH